jgi:purine-nucleoside phosphorylase
LKSPLQSYKDKCFSGRDNGIKAKTISMIRDVKNYVAAVETCAEFLRRKIPTHPTVALIAGSGQGGLANLVEKEVELPYHTIPNFPRSTVPGHRGTMVVGRAGEKSVAILCGRWHLYEGIESWNLVLPIRVLATVGVRVLIVSNSAGGLHPDFVPGDIMLITDHINFTFRNPLVGPNLEMCGPRFPDMSSPYSRDLQDRAREGAREERIPLKEGVYAANLGPNYETHAETNLLRLAGAHAVGMSTVPEILAAVHAGMKTLGLSVITNSLVRREAPLTHDEVLTTAKQAEQKLIVLIRSILRLT